MNQELTISMPVQPILLHADPARLTQVVGNLLNNACKFTNPDGHVWLDVAQQGNDAVIKVRDDGIGISAEQLPRLFEMFTQVDSSLERSRDGLGIGLTLAKTLVEMHDGTIEARSEGLGRGSEFIVRLPCLADASIAVKAHVAAESTHRSGRLILVVDDNADGAQSLAMLLTLYGHEVQVAHDGPEAIEFAAKLHPDAVLLDIGLPEMNGYEVCRRMRRETWGKGILLVAVTGWGQEDDRKKSQEAGFDFHLVKPVDHEALFRLFARPPEGEETGVKG